MIGLGTLINSAGIIAGGAYCNSCGISAVVLIQRIFFTRRQKTTRRRIMRQRAVF